MPSHNEWRKAQCKANQTHSCMLTCQMMCRHTQQLLHLYPNQGPIGLPISLCPAGTVREQCDGVLRSLPRRQYAAMAFQGGTRPERAHLQALCAFCSALARSFHALIWWSAGQALSRTKLAAYREWSDRKLPRSSLAECIRHSLGQMRLWASQQPTQIYTENWQG